MQQKKVKYNYKQINVQIQDMYALVYQTCCQIDTRALSSGIKWP